MTERNVESDGVHTPFRQILEKIYRFFEVTLLSKAYGFRKLLCICWQGYLLLDVFQRLDSIQLIL